MTRVSICPKCRLPDIRRDTSSKIEGAFGLPSRFICNNCGHIDTYFPEVDIEEVENLNIKKVKQKEELVDTSFGRFQVSVFWKITEPLILLFGIIILVRFGMVGLIPLLFGLFMVYKSYLS